MDTYHRPRIAKEILIALIVCFFVWFFSVVALLIGVISAIFPLVVSSGGIFWLGSSIRKWLMTPEIKEGEENDHKSG
jgi:uncharacterized membrane protein YfbV (UPF0208 family)